MGEKMCKMLCPCRRGAARKRTLHQSSCTKPLLNDGSDGERCVKYTRLDISRGVSTQGQGSALLMLPEEQIESIASWLDLASFAAAFAPSCLLVHELVSFDSFEGWKVEIQRLHDVCPWTAKIPIERLLIEDEDLKARRYRKALKCLDREFAATGLSVVQSTLRLPRAVNLPSFFDCKEDTLVYTCRTCESFITCVDSTVGRGSMGRFHQAAFILQPQATIPFCCGIEGNRETRLSSGTYILADLVCPNGNCDSILGWKYQNCVPEGNHVPQANFLKIGQFWLYADALDVVMPRGDSAGYSGDEFYSICNF